ncbi:hypothetical protein HRbin08_01452 [bacterium HR08]|nr:hypothetical protein HRbin08_01452 [bacterium HR08]
MLPFEALGIVVASDPEVEGLQAIGRMRLALRE